ncbi:hypothetical protein P3T21_000070 [Paraburkholderia sp. GAS334]
MRRRVSQHGAYVYLSNIYCVYIYCLNIYNWSHISDALAMSENIPALLGV